MKILPCILLLFALHLTSALGNPISIRQNDTLDELTTKSGEVYKDVTIREIKKTGVVIRHSYGGRTIPAHELPEYAYLFKRIEEPEKKAPLPQATNNKAIPKAQPKLAWEPKSLDDVTEACLLVKVTKGINELGDKADWIGSAFLCNIGRTTYIYGNAHHFFGAKEFHFEFKDGRKFDPREYAGIQVASGMIGHCKKSNLGGDVIRIPLRNFYPKALRLHNYILSEKYDLGRNISVIGVHSNSDSLVKHSGTLYSIYGYDVFAHSAVSDTACNGGPIVDNHSFKLIGMQTWRQRPTNPLEIIWKQRGTKKNLKWSSGVSLSRMAFSKSSFESLYEDRLLLNTITTNIRLLGLVNAIQPHKDGILLSKSRRVMGGYTINDLLESHPNHYIVKSLKSLDTKLRKGGSRIGMSNHDVWKMYRTTYRGALNYSAQLRAQLSSNSSYKSNFSKYQLEKLKLIEVCQAYEIWIAKSLSWFERQLGTSGDAMPVGHPGLPSINRGLDALGIKQSFKDGDDEQNSEEKKKAKELADKAKQFREEEDARIDSEKIERSQRIWSNLASQSNAIKSNGGRIDSLPPMYGSMSDSQLFHAQELQDQYTREAKKLNIRSYVSPQQDINAMRNLNNRR